MTPKVYALLFLVVLLKEASGQDLLGRLLQLELKVHKETLKVEMQFKNLTEALATIKETISEDVRQMINESRTDILSRSGEMKERVNGIILDTVKNIQSGLISEKVERIDLQNFAEMTKDRLNILENDKKKCGTSNGSKGEPGTNGPKGKSGLPGRDGRPGKPGASGPKGETGQRGQVGRTGKQGASGRKGETGQPGQVGRTGKQGASGLKGETGQRGQVGRKGEPGASGSRRESVSPGLVGRKGEPGTAGPKGESGLPGRDGRKGERGTSRPKGESGLPGLKGSKGEAGTCGAKCESGLPGLVAAKDCWDIKRKDRAAVDGVYEVITPDGHRRSLRCDMTTDGGGWTVFQRRGDGSVSFDQDWETYRSLFGNLTGEYWMGNEFLTEMTQAVDQTLRVDICDWDGQTRWAQYRRFSVGGAQDNYPLQFQDYTGTAGDGLGTERWGSPLNLNGSAFSTRDRDNDRYSDGNCAATPNSGAWWYNWCSAAYLNGQYRQEDSSNTWSGIQWRTWIRRHSYKGTEMKMRPSTVTPSSTTTLQPFSCPVI